MMRNQLFDLEKINEITDPIDELQEKLNYFSFTCKNLVLVKNEAIKKIEQKLFIEQIEEIDSLINYVKNELIDTSNNNINKFFAFKDTLTKKYKDQFKDSLKELKINQNFLQEIGLYLIENKKISRIIENTSSVLTITTNRWIDLLESLKYNPLFLSVIKKMDVFYNALIQERFEIEKSQISKEVEPELIDEYKKIFLNEPTITFKEFIEEIESILSKEALESKQKIIEGTKEREKLMDLKRTQEEQLQSYEDYFKLSPKAFQIKLRKGKREKLSDLLKKPNNVREVSVEVSEKIEKFKSKFERGFEEKYFIVKDDTLDPLDLIRERKKLKEEEYEKFYKKFKNKS